MISADDQALHFLNSLATPAGETVDWLANGKALLAWLRATDIAETADLLAAEELPADVMDQVAGQARWLREWSRGAIKRWSASDDLELPSFVPLNNVLSLDRTWRSIVAEAGRVTWRSERDRSNPQWLLALLAGVIGKLLIQGERSRVRLCEGTGCTLWFYDASRSNKRRWCSMAICGNRSKVAAHRARARS